MRGSNKGSVLFDPLILAFSRREKGFVGWSSGGKFVEVALFNRHFKKRVLEVVSSRPDVEWFILDGSPVNAIDSTGAEALEALAAELAERGARFGIANLRTETRAMLERSSALTQIGAEFVFPTLKSAIKAFQASRPAPRLEVEAGARVHEVARP